MKKIVLKIKKIFLFCIFITSFFTGCLFNVNNEKPEPDIKNNSYDSTQGIVYLDELPNYDEMRNVSYYADFDKYKPEGISGKNAFYTTDEIFAGWANSSRATDVLTDKHGTVCKLTGKNLESYIQFSTRVDRPSVLSFYMKSDMYDDDVLKVNVDNKTFKVPHKGNGELWKKVSLKLNAGNHNIKIFVPRQRGYSPQLKNAIYIDNITVVADKIEFIEIYPKGLQEGVVGQPMQFKAVPMRGDRSVIDNYDYINYSVSGCGNINPKTGLFTPTCQGDCTVSVYIDGKTVHKTDVKVHSKTYISDPVTIGNYTFTGRVNNPSGNAISTGDKIKLDYAFSPMTDTFNADGFFVLKGNTSVPMLIQVVRDDNTNYKTSFLVRKAGKFSKRIWLRFGKGNYTVFITEAPDMSFNNTLDSRYEGDFTSSGSCPVVEKLHVTNTSNIGLEEALWLMPSEVVQSDSFYVSNMSNAILAGLPVNASLGDKLRAIHDWELYNLHYDMVSVNHQEQRKRQDAEHVIKYGMGVCEGYANLYAALVRKAGIPAKVIGSDKLCHAWNHVFYNGQWYLVDVTWDDPVTDNSDSYNDRAVGRENYTYFMTAHTDGNHTDAGAPETGRSAAVEEKLPAIRGVPEGWY